MEREEYEAKKAENDKIRYNLEHGEIGIVQRLQLLNVLRYNLGLMEETDKVEKVVYDEIGKRLVYSESVEIGLAISLKINEAIIGAESIEDKQTLYGVMKETYYYLARYLFEYFLPAMEFGIPPEKQFIAPRTSVLNPIAREMSKFYYRKDRPIMTLSMPQGTRKDGSVKEVYVMGDRERQFTAKYDDFVFGKYSKRQVFQWNRCVSK